MGGVAEVIIAAARHKNRATSRGAQSFDDEGSKESIAPADDYAKILPKAHGAPLSIDHDRNQFLKMYTWLPSKLFAGLCAVSNKSIHF